MTNAMPFSETEMMQAAGIAPRPFDFKIDFELKWEQMGMTEDTGVPVFKPVEVLHLRAANNIHHVVKVEEWRARHNVEWSRFVEAGYQKWKINLETPSSGTPLEMVPVLTTPAVLQFKYIGINTAEELLAAPEDRLLRVPDATKLKDQVKRFVEAGKKAGEVSKLLLENEKLLARVAYLDSELKKVNDKFIELTGGIKK